MPQVASPNRWVEEVGGVTSGSGSQDNGASDVEALLQAVVGDEWGRVAPSIYDTARLVSLAPYLPGHRERLEFLCRTQAADGGWGAPDGYAVLPTLSATE